MVLVQHIVLRWSRRQRGAVDRERRARLPRALPLPIGVLARALCVRHLVTCGRYPTKPDERVEADALLCVKRGACSIDLREVDGVLLVSFGTGDEGAPQRLAPPPLALAQGTWGRARYNGRFVGFDEVWYEEKTINIAYDVPPARGLFTSTAPHALLDAQVDLW
jgi:hypothetical protein